MRLSILDGINRRWTYGTASLKSQNKAHRPGQPRKSDFDVIPFTLIRVPGNYFLKNKIRRAFKHPRQNHQQDLYFPLVKKAYIKLKLNASYAKHSTQSCFSSTPCSISDDNGFSSHLKVLKSGNFLLSPDIFNFMLTWLNNFMKEIVEMKN